MDEVLTEEDTAEQKPEQKPKRGEHLKPWHFQPGQSGNPSGRPKGVKSLKQFAKEYLESLPDEEKIEFMQGMDKRDVWQMAEGKPMQATDITTNGKDLPTPLLTNVLPTDDSPTESSIA